MTSLGINEVTPDHGDSGWQRTAMYAASALLMIFAGWGWADSQTSRSETRQELRVMRDQIAGNQQRIATTEEALRQMQRSLDRIETTLEDIRRRR